MTEDKEVKLLVTPELIRDLQKVCELAKEYLVIVAKEERIHNDDSVGKLLRAGYARDRRSITTVSGIVEQLGSSTNSPVI